MGAKPGKECDNRLHSRRTGGLVASVDAGSPAGEAGIAAGDLVLSLDGHPLGDIIDYQFHLEPGRQELEVVRGEQRLILTLEHGVEDPGIVFAGAIFDRITTCACNCIFCFVDQLPAGLRPSLYLKDDDFRLSFLHGNFITLNGISHADMDRIIAQRLSPLYVSVHATDTVIRARMMGVNEKAAAQGLENLRRLGEAGIETHIQVVLCPGINDGAVLERTVRELGDSYPAVASVGVVPVSVANGSDEGNKWQQRRGKKAPRDTNRPAGSRRQQALRQVTPADSRAVIRAIEAWQQAYRNSRGSGFVYAADEFYLLAGRELPPADSYDGFPQYENGIGIAASFLAEAGELKKLFPMTPPEGGSVFFLTGTLAAGIIKEACGMLSQAAGTGDAERLSGASGGKQWDAAAGRAATDGDIPEPAPRFRPLVVENRLLGPHVTVTGLLGGRDIIAAARDAGLGRRDLLLIPSTCLNNPGEQLFLDDISLSEMNEILPCAVLSKWLS